MWVTWTLLGQVSCAGNLDTAWTGFSTGFLYSTCPRGTGWTLVLLVNWVVIVGLYIALGFSCSSGDLYTCNVRRKWVNVVLTSTFHHNH